MTNVKDNDMDLALALSINNQCVQSVWNNASSTDPGVGTGANANARSRTFAGSRTFTELVWSPQNGLSIKCADQNACLVTGVGPSKTGVSPSCSDASGDAKDGKRASEGGSFGSREKRCVENEVNECCSSPKSPFLGSSLGHTGPQNRKAADLLPLFANKPESTDPMPSKTQAVTLWMPQEHVERGQDLDKSKENSSSSAPYLEATAENDAIWKNEAKDGQGDLIARDEDGSHGSMESCNSANLHLLSKRDRTWSFDRPLILGSKRIKKQTQESPFFTPLVKQDSSFMNWISNMVKGMKPSQDEGPSLALTVQEKVSKKLGFHTVFQSLYALDEKGLETRTQIEDKSVGDSKEFLLAHETCATAHGTRGSDQIPNDVKDGLSSFGSSHHVKTSDNRGSLWITRLCTKTPSNHSEIKTIMAKDDASGASGSKKVNKDKFKQPVGVTFSGMCPKESGEVVSKKRVSSSDEIPKQISSGFGKGDLLNEENVLEAPKEMFDAIRRLRLSRTDILKWTKSRSSIAPLDGFFVRLRLAKWEEGLGGAGYYVACINGSQGEKPSKGSQKPICVDVDGVECLIESRYVSNCDFLEDELVAWWRKIARSGRIPMEGDLNSKLEERKKLCL